MVRRHRGIAGLPLLLLVLAACGDEDDDQPVRPATIEVTVDDDEGSPIEGFHLAVTLDAGGEEHTVQWDHDEHVLLRQVAPSPVTVTAAMQVTFSEETEPCVLDLDVSPGSVTRIVASFDGTCAVDD